MMLDTMGDGGGNTETQAHQPGHDKSDSEMIMDETSMSTKTPVRTKTHVLELLDKDRKVGKAIGLLEIPDVISNVIVRLEEISISDMAFSGDDKIIKFANRLETLRNIFDSTKQSIFMEAVELFKWGVVIEEEHGLAESAQNRFVFDESGVRIPIKQFWKGYFVDSGCWSQDVFDRTWEGAVRSGPKVYRLIRILGEFALFMPLISDGIRWRTIANRYKINDLRMINLKTALEKYEWKSSFTDLNTQLRDLLSSDNNFIQESKIVLKSNIL